MKSENSCYICEKKNSISFKIRKNNINLVECSNCKIIYIKQINHIKKKILNYYRKSYFNSKSIVGYSDYQSLINCHKKNSIQIFNSINLQNKKKKLSILDFGCGHGYLLVEAKKFFEKKESGARVDVVGIENSNYAREVGKIINKISIFKNLNTIKKKFDIIFMIGTIEHLIDPKKIVIELNKKLKKNGILVFTTIDTNGYFPVYKLKPPEHTFYFNYRNLSILLSKCNLKIVLKKTYFAYYHVYDLFYRLGAFFNVNLLIKLSIFFKKYFKKLIVFIPTNEILVISKK